MAGKRKRAANPEDLNTLFKFAPSPESPPASNKKARKEEHAAGTTAPTPITNTSRRYGRDMFEQFLGPVNVSLFPPPSGLDVQCVTVTAYFNAKLEISLVKEEDCTRPIQLKLFLTPWEWDGNSGCNEDDDGDTTDDTDAVDGADGDHTTSHGDGTDHSHSIGDGHGGLLHQG